MQFQQPFDARTVEPASFPPPPPLADYHVRIVESDGKPTTDGSGGYLELTLEILDPGPYQNRKIPYRLNLYNKNQQTVEIAYRQLSAVCYVCNVFQIQDSRQLHGIPFIATIGPQTNNPQYANVFAVKDINGNQPGKMAGSTPAAAAPPAAAPPAAPAWAPPQAAAPAAPAMPSYSAPPAAPAWSPATTTTTPPPAYAPPPAWAPPGNTAPAQPAAAPPAAAPPWQAPAGAPPAAPPWAR